MGGKLYKGIEGGKRLRREGLVLRTGMYSDTIVEGMYMNFGRERM